MMEKVSMEIAGRQLEIETGRIARQANGAVMVRYGDTQAMVTICMGRNERKIDFFPLQVEYREKFFAAGKIPGGFLKREGRPKDREVLIGRLTDRPMRPLFDKRMRNEIQVIASVLSVDGVTPPDTLAMIGGSAAACISDIPFAGPIGAVIVGLIDGEIIVNPTREQMARSTMELVVSGSSDAVVMVEGEAHEVDEDTVIKSIEAGHVVIKQIVALQEELVKKAGKTKKVIELHAADPNLVAEVTAKATPLIAEVITIAGKQERGDAQEKAFAQVKAQYESRFEAEPLLESDVTETLYKVVKEMVRDSVLEKEVRIDGRKWNEIRQISCDLGLLCRTHGSALFTRGETQAMATLTLGTKADEQRMDDIEGDERKKFMLHYNFPGFCVGECGRMFTGRREIGHGNLAERALQPVLPTEEQFPYTIRIVSDITESNGSSSMASVCGGSLALMDGGVPISAPVAGIAMGLIKGESKHAILSDILGQEDALGDMDFKVTGTEKGINSLQMDIKIKGLSTDLMREALEQARQGRVHILGEMAKAITEPRAELSQYAPQIVFLKVPIDKIGALIGPGGKMIRSICEEFGVTVNVEDDGTVIVGSPDGPSLEAATAKINSLTEEVEVGKSYTGEVKKIMDFGAFVEVLPGTDGLVHISELAKGRIAKVTDVLKEGETITVKCIGIDKNGKIKLSLKALLD